jgi:hypothetical protein
MSIGLLRNRLGAFAGQTWVAVLAMIFVCAPCAGATEHLDEDRPEAWAMAYFTSATLFTGFGTPRAREPGSVELGLELDWLPHLSNRQRTVGFDGAKEEDLNKSPVFGRFGLTFGLRHKLAFSIGYTPPVRMFGVKPHLVAFALERPLYERGPWTLGARVHTQIGRVDGAFTCPGDVAKQPPGSDGNPFGCDASSDDAYLQRYVGLELSGSYRLEALGGLTPHVAVSGNYLDARFHVHASLYDEPDRNKLAADTGTFSMTAGFRYPLTEAIELGVLMFYSPLSVKRPPSVSSDHDSLINLRSQLAYRFP